MTKTNSEAKAHAESKHATATFEQCFPGQVNPDAPVAVTEVSTSVAANTVAPKKKKQTEDLSFLDESLSFKAGKK